METKKTLLALTLTLTLAPAIAMAAPGQSALIQQARGDLNFDHRLDIADITALTHYLNGSYKPTRSALAAMDLNRDGRVDIADLVLLTQMVFGGQDDLDDGRTTASVPAGPTEMFSILYGDVNGDGQVDVADVVTLSHYLSGTSAFTKVPIDNGDVNGDGFVNIADLVALFGYVM